MGSWLTRCVFIFWCLCDLKRDQQTAVGSVSKKCFYDYNGFDVLVLVQLHAPGSECSGKCQGVFMFLLPSRSTYLLRERHLLLTFYSKSQ